MEHQVFEADLHVIRSDGLAVTSSGLDFPHPMKCGNVQAVAPVPAKRTNELSLIQSARHVASVADHMNNESVRNLPFDDRNIEKIIGAPHSPALETVSPRHFLHHGPQKFAARGHRGHNFFCYFFGVEAGAPELSRAKPTSHHLAPGANAAKIPKSRNQQIKDTRFCSVNWEAPR